MQYPRDCAADLLLRLRKHDADGETSRPLPDFETLGVMLDVAFAASMEPEEGRFATFSLGFVPRGRQTTLYKEVPFTTAIELSTANVARLAGATDPALTSLALWREPQGEPRIWGLITSENQGLGSSPAQENPTFLPRAPFFSIRARAPGVLGVYHWHQLHLLFVRGGIYFSPPSGRLQEILRDGAGLKPLDATAVSQIAARISTQGHGGTILLTPPESQIPVGVLDVSYPFTPPSSLLRDAVAEPMTTFAERPAERHALDFVARLSRVDGAVHLTSDLQIRGFGAKIASTTQPFALTAEDTDGTNRRELPLSTIPGTRHRSAAFFCAQQTGQALAIVVSQDGDVSLFGRQRDGSVLRVGPFVLGTGLTVGS